MRVVGWVRVCGGWRRHLDEERQLQEFSRQRENNQAGEHRKAHIHESKPEQKTQAPRDEFCRFWQVLNLILLIGWDPAGLQKSPRTQFLTPGAV